MHGDGGQGGRSGGSRRLRFFDGAGGGSECGLEGAFGVDGLHGGGNGLAVAGVAGADKKADETK